MKAMYLRICCAALALAPAIASAADEKPVAATLTDTSVGSNLLQTTFGLLIVLAVIGAAAWLFKRFGHYQVGVQGKMKVVGGVSLGPRERVVLLQVGDSQLLLGVAPGQIRTLHVLDKPLAVDVPAEDAPNFAARLQDVLRGKLQP